MSRTLLVEFQSEEAARAALAALEQAEAHGNIAALSVWVQSATSAILSLREAIDAREAQEAARAAGEGEGE